jgi:YidC/Oxa1 family membrane protein insertase
MMEKRVILAIGLSALVFIAFTYYQQKYMVPPPVSHPAVQTPVQEPAKPAPSPATEAPTVAKPALVPSADDTKAFARKVVVAGKNYRAVIDNKGAVLSSWELTEYRSAREETKYWYEYIFGGDSRADKSHQSPIFEMIAGTRDGKPQMLPASIIFPDASLTELANKEFYQVSIEGGSGTGGALVPPATVILNLKRGDVSIEKRFRFEKDKYLVDLSMNCEKNGKALEGKFFLAEDLGPEPDHFLSSVTLEAVYYAGGKVHREKPPKNENEVKKLEGDVRWVGLNMQYFAMVAIPDRPLPYFDIQKLSIKAKPLKGDEVNRDLLRITTPVNGSLQYKLYLGPKTQADLEAVKATDLTGVIDYGWTSIVVLPLLASLRWIYQFVHNYGYAIIVLTFLLSLLLFPFRLKQMLSMKKMQAVQPKVKAIQEKYKRYKKTDPKRAEMNQEVMALYKEHNVNPLGGCVPLILQFPLLFAFYSLLANSIELRQAPFMFWLQDLSIQDPTYVLPIIMGITMFISQKMTPMAPTTDPTQAKMMMIMPVVFTFMFLHVSSGLNLYFLCSNIFQIAFQKIAERWMSGARSGN